MHLAALMLLAAVPSPADEPPMIPAFFTGDALYDICSRPNAGQCSMYVAGVLDGMFYTRSRDGGQFCPSRMNNREAADVVLRFLVDNPDLRPHAASVIVREALADRLDCAPQEEEQEQVASAAGPAGDN